MRLRAELGGNLFDYNAIRKVSVIVPSVPDSGSTSDVVYACLVRPSDQELMKKPHECYTPNSTVRPLSEYLVCGVAATDAEC